MNPEKLLEYLLTSNDAGVAAYLLVTIIIMGWLLYTERIVLGKTWRTQQAKQTATDELLEQVQDRLTEQRLLNERSAARIEAQASEILQLQLEVARLKGVLGRQGARK